MSEPARRPLSQEERLDWLRLIRSENVGPITFYRLLERFGTAAKALEALPELARRGGRAKAIRTCPRAVAEAEIAALDGMGARLVGRDEPDYPPLLAQIEDAPPLIAVRGHIHLLRKRAVALVGARNASVGGCRFARHMAADLGRHGLLVVSGLARGIDACAHEGALETGTVGVVAGGVDVVYPKENAALYDALAESGAIVSEVEAGTQPQARHFPRRNRLISGISRGVVVVEAGLRSGSLITARIALDQNREVFAVPGAPSDPRGKGANDLIRKGTAHLTESADDVLEVLNRLFAQPLRERGPVTFGVPSAAAPPAESELDPARKAIAAALGPTAVTVDEIIRQCQFSPAVTSTVLLELELAGRLERHPGNRVSLLPDP